MRGPWQGILAALLAAGLSGCAIANMAPSPGPAPTGHRTILAIGDSLMGQNDVELPDVLASQGIDATVIDAHVNGSGLIGPVGGQPSALQWVESQIMAHPEADTVIVEWAGACAMCDQPGFPAFGSPEFFATWRSNALAIMDYLRKRGLPTIWVRSPPVGTSSDTAASGSKIRILTTLQLCDIEMTELAPYASSATADWFAALTDLYGRYANYLYYDRDWHRVRTDDLVHFTADGATRTALWTARGLTDLWQTSPPPSQPHTLGHGPRLVEAGDPVTLQVPPGL